MEHSPSCTCKRLVKLLLNELHKVVEKNKRECKDVLKERYSLELVIENSNE